MRDIRSMARRIVAKAELALPPGTERLPDNDQWTNRFEVRSETSDRVYTVAQNKKRGHWGCSCPAWRTRRKCKHLKALGLPELEEPHRVTVASDRTRSFTPEQRTEVDAVVGALVHQSIKRINAEAPRIRGMDRRPEQGWTDEQPEVRFPYVAQAMLEDLIHDLEKLV